MKLGNTTQSGRDFVLSRQALRTLTAKIKRDGIPVLLKTLYQVSAAESPLDAIAGHREVVALFERPSLAALRARGFANKYLSGYMAKSLGKVARRKILLHHYRRLDQKLGDDFYSGNSRILWREPSADGTFSIALTFNAVCHYEGDLSLVFSCDGKRIFEISFAIAPGEVIGSASRELLLIGRVQGVKDQFDAIKRATKACQDVAPQHMLMLAVQSIAQALGIECIAAVQNRDQLANLPKAYFAFDYNTFWESFLTSKTERGFYEFPVPLPQKALREVQMSHRRRTRRKREFKASVGGHLMKVSAELLRGAHAMRAARSGCRPETERTVNPAHHGHRRILQNAMTGPKIC
jgi:uncharacterized protein VirK/YbjX